MREDEHGRRHNRALFGERHRAGKGGGCVLALLVVGARAPIHMIAPVRTGWSIIEQYVAGFCDIMSHKVKDLTVRISSGGPRRVAVGRPIALTRLIAMLGRIVKCPFFFPAKVPTQNERFAQYARSQRVHVEGDEIWRT